MNIVCLIVSLVLVGAHGQSVGPNSILGRESSSTDKYDPDAVCPKTWFFYGVSCYRFTRSPIKSREEAKQYCRAFNADLASVNSMEEHSFITSYLQKVDPSHRIWYVGGRSNGQGNWQNEDGTAMMNLDAAFLPNQEQGFDKEFLAYAFSISAKQWGLLRTDGRDPLLYICEIPSTMVLFVLL